MNITVYDYTGIPRPGARREGRPAGPKGTSGVNATRPAAVFGNRTAADIYRSYRSSARGECRFCHSRWNRREVIGALSFERRYDATVYYSSERIMIFMLITMVLGLLLYALVRWDPGKNIKELFDK